MCERKAASRLAVDIHQQLVSDNKTHFTCELPEAHWQQFQNVRRRMYCAQQHGRRLAAGECERE